ncbi:uncharacterized protein BDR25DRAFT_340204 [Lindgomyces ingoldianus]|uniref:Uncharacterized protein n=1 Tax=Lindgomyces ingoldianus TaxID=673940 RepID=A0ACB6R818_9PLEO|nr:uncharacterized protein BDR25DRAFT_340204 [Lindgomyces ingoldianus]KAF2475458.1 hypothetical protein BDR25DRAFT_340204 [Lindgomyces ingoldianus]
MDLIPTPLESIPGVKVPLMSIIPYDFKDFSEFPQRHGFELEQLLAADQAPVLIASVMQSWLFFGLLSEFFQRPVNTKEFSSLDNSSSSRVISLRPLGPLLRSQPRNVDLKGRCALVERATDGLRFLEDSPVYQQYTPPISEIGLSVRMLIYALAPESGGPIIKLSPHPLISRRLRDAGWCPSHIRRIEGLKNDLLGYYLSLLRRPNPRGFRHDACPPTNCEASSTSLSKDYVSRHTHVDGGPCPLIHVDQKQVRAIIANGDIPLISIQFSSTGAITLKTRPAQSRDRFIAISHVWSDGLGNPNSNALPRCQLNQLGAYLQQLPHPSTQPVDGDFRSVFSYGPVSVDLAKLSIILRKSKRPTWFWMDTLCIPISTDSADKETKELKKRAIDLMAVIYGSASQILVLDSSIQQSRISTMDTSEMLARISFSNWMGRCWTLQEGALSPYVYFQCADGAINILSALPRPRFPQNLFIHPASFRLTDLSGTLQSLKWTWQHSTELHHYNSCHIRGNIEQLIYNTLYSLCTTSLHISGQSKAQNFYKLPLAQIPLLTAQWVQELVSVWNALSIRTTTMAEDLPAIFANLLGLNAYHVLGLPPQERLRAIIEAGDALPVSFLYNCGPRVRPNENHRGRWIPTVLNRYALNEMPLMRFDAARNVLLRTSDMLHHEVHISPTFLLFQRSLPIVLEEFIVKTKDGKLWKIICHRDEDDQLDCGPFKCTGLLIRSAYGQGCCLRLMHGVENTKFEGIYDCPCTVKELQEDDLDISSRDLFSADQIDSWTIKLLNDSDPAIALKPRISQSPKMTFFNPNESAHWLLRFLSIWLPLIPLILVPMILRIYIAAHSEWSTLSTIGRASLIAFIVQRIPTPLSFFPITQALFIVDRKQSVGGLCSLDIAYVVLDLIWIAYVGFAFALTVQQWVQYRFEYQLSVLKQDWKQEPDIGKVWTVIQSHLPGSWRRRIEKVMFNP